MDELGVEPERTQYMGYLIDGHDGIAHCYSGELGAEQAIPDGMAVQGLRELSHRLETCYSAWQGAPCSL